MASLWIKLDSHNLVTQVYTDIVKPTVGNLRKKWNEIAGSGRFNFESFPFFAGKSVSNIQKKKKKNESKKKVSPDSFVTVYVRWKQTILC